MFSRVIESIYRDATSLIGRFSLLKPAIGNIGVKGVSALMLFCNGILLARLLGAEQFGKYSIAIAIANLAISAVTFGLPTLATREAAALTTLGDWKLLHGFVRTSHIWVGFATALLTAVGILYSLDGWDNLSVSREAVIAIVLLGIFGAFTQLRAALIRGFGRVVVADIPELVVKPGLMLILLLAILLKQGITDVTTALFLQAIAAGAGVGLLWVMLSRMTPRLIRESEPKYKTALWFKEAVPLGAIGLITIVEGQISLYLLGIFSTGYEAGLYQASVRLVGPIAMGLIAVNLSLQPRVAAAWASRDRRGAQAIITEGAIIGAVLAGAAALILVAFSDRFLSWFGPEFRQANVALYVLVFGQLINALSGSCGLVLVMTGHQRVALIGIGAALLANGILGGILIPGYGASGAAIASAAGFLVWNSVMVWYAWRKIGLFTPAIRIGRKVRMS